MANVSKVLIIGGGVGGMSCAIQLRKLGIAVELIDIDPHWRVYGAGITITGPTLRALNVIGVLDEVRAAGATWDGMRFFDRNGTLLQDVEVAPVAPGIPATGGIMRPALHKILSGRTTAMGTQVRLGVSMTALAQKADRVHVSFSDGREDSYDLVVAADGIYSRTRELVFPTAPKPKFTGQCIYRIVAERPAGFDRTHFYMGGTSDMKVGFNPVSSTHMYMFLLQHLPDNPWVPAEEQPQRLYELMEGFGGIVPQVRATVRTTNAHTINYRPLEALLLPRPWHDGRVLLIGDATHATTPHLASGAGMAIEDGLVLAQELQRDDDVPAALARFNERRFERCRLVVENSLRLGELEMHHGSTTEHTQLMAASIEALRNAI